MKKPRALLINPPVHDFALYDHFLQPYGLFRLEELLTEAGYDVDFIDALDISDPLSLKRFGPPVRRPDGTGKFFRQAIPFPAADPGPGGLPETAASMAGNPSGSGAPAWFSDPGRSYARYGIAEESLREAVSGKAGGRAAPDIVLVTTGMTYWYPGVVEACRIVQELHPGVPILAGGIYASLMPGHCERATGATAVPGPAEGNLSPVLERLGFPPLGEARGEDRGEGSEQGRGEGRGEGCGTTENYVSAIKPVKNGDLHGCGDAIKGCSAGHLHAGTTGSTRIATRNTRLETARIRGSGVLRLSTGCPFHCAYCASRAIDPRFRRGDPARAYEEFSALYDAGIRNFGFYDDALLFEKERLLFPFLDMIERGGQTPSFYLPNACHARYIDRETAARMMRGGFREVRIGYESASPGFHDEYGVKFGPDAVVNAVEALRAAGYTRNRIRLYIIAGLPGQTREEAEKTVRFSLDMGARPVLTEYSPIPGSELWDRCVRECRLPLADEPLFQNNTLFPMEWGGFTRADLEELKRMARAETEE